MATKNFSLNGVGSKVQYGKKGGHFGWAPGGFRAETSDGTTLASVRGAIAINSDEFVTLSQLTGSASGINVKLGVAATTTGQITNGTIATAATLTAEVAANGEISAINIDGGGSGYPDGARIKLVITVAGGSGAVAYATATGGVIDTAVITASGEKYTPGSDLAGVAAADATWLSGSGFTAGAPTVVDGVPVTAGDRILVRLEGVTVAGDGSIVVGDGAERNGIYQVVSDGVWVRATDSDTDGEILYGDYTLVTGGSTRGSTSYILSNLASIDTGEANTYPTMDTPDLNLPDGPADNVNTTYQAWVLFSQAPLYDAKTLGGLELANNEFGLDFANLAANSVAETTDVMAVQKVGGEMQNIPVSQALNDLDVVHSSGFATGIVGKSADNTFYGVNVLASTELGFEGSSVTFDPAASSDVVVGLDINGLAAPGAAIDGSQFIAVADGLVNGNRKITVTTLLSDMEVPTNIGATAGFVHSDGAGTYTTGGVAVDGAGNKAGLTVATGTGPTATVGLDILNTAAGTAELTDTLVAYKVTGAANVAITVQQIIDLVSGAISDNEISQGDSSVVVSDSGTDGLITFTTDGVVVAAMNEPSGLVASKLTGQNLTDTRVLFAGAGGTITDDGGFTYSAATDALTVGGVVNAGAVSAGSGTFTTTLHANGAISGSTTITGQSVIATGGLSGNSLTTTTTAQIGSLVLDQGVVFTDATGTLLQDDGVSPAHSPFTYNPADGTLTVENLVVNGSGGSSLLVDQVGFGDGNGNTIGDAEFLYNATTDTLTVGNAQIVGDAGGSATYTSTEVNGDILLAPTGTGDVIIQGTGDAELSAEAGQQLTLKGDGVVLQSTDGLTTYAEFSAGTGSDNYLVLDSSATLSSPTITAEGTDTDVGIGFVMKGNGTLTVATPGIYDAAVVDASLVTKKYVDSAIQGAVVPGTQGSVSATIDLAAAGATVLIAGGDIPAAGYKITRVALKVTTASDAASTVTVAGSGTYMTDVENDPELVGIYLADNYSQAAQGTDITSTVAVPGSTGTAELTVEYIVQ